MHTARLSCLASMISSLLLLLTNPALAQCAHNEPLVTFSAEVPLLDCDGVPCVDAHTPDGKIWKLGIDTGNENSVISAQAAQMAGLKPKKPTPKGWPAEMFITALPALRIGDATLKDIQFVAMDFSGDIAKGTMPHLDGTLAYTAFKNRYLPIRFCGARVPRLRNYDGSRGLRKDLRQDFPDYLWKARTADRGRQRLRN